ncbi:MAG: hypothetical protein ACP5VE_01635 [Chthonomonadales bacterium]
MRAVLVYRLLVGVALLQIALFGVLGNGSYGDVLCARQVPALLFGRSLHVGDRMPGFVAYTAGGTRVRPAEGHRPDLFIFYGCGCDSDRIRGWTEAAQARGEAVSIFTPKPPAELASQRAAHKIAVPIYAIRSSEMQTVVGIHALPLAIHVSQDGTVLAIEQ